jgi:hypothetical protein
MAWCRDWSISLHHGPPPRCQRHAPRAIPAWACTRKKASLRGLACCLLTHRRCASISTGMLCDPPSPCSRSVDGGVLFARKVSSRDGGGLQAVGNCPLSVAAQPWVGRPRNLLPAPAGLWHGGYTHCCPTPADGTAGGVLRCTIPSSRQRCLPPAQSATIDTPCTTPSWMRPSRPLPCSRRVSPGRSCRHRLVNTFRASSSCRRLIRCHRSLCF